MNPFVVTLAVAAVMLSKPVITATAVTPDGKGFVVGSQSGVMMREWDGEPQQAVATQLDNVHALEFSPDGSALAVSGGSPAEFGSVELWSWPGRARVGQLDGHDDIVYETAWLGDGNVIVTASADRTVRVWQTATGKEIAKLVGHSGPVLCLAVSPDAALLCTGSTDQTIRVWDTRSWQLVRTFTNHLGPVHSLSFKPLGRASGAAGAPIELASAGGDGTVRIWQPGIGRMLRIVRHPAPVFAIWWTPDNSLVSGSKRGLHIIDSASGDMVRNRPNGDEWVTSLAVSPDHKRIVVGTSSGNVEVVSVVTTDR
jgi:WD40 repeat protein